MSLVAGLVSILIIGQVNPGAPVMIANDPDLKTDRIRYAPGGEVVIRLVNDTDKTIFFENPWRIVRTKSNRRIASMSWDADPIRLAPDERWTWRWDQRKGDCATDCTYEGDEFLPRAGPGRYTVVVRTSAGTLRRNFEVGRFFTLGFDGHPDDTFVVFLIERGTIAQMKAEAAAEDKTLIVSGIVRREWRYNRPWSYTMGPGSVVLGEVFVEVCDASPDYVEENHFEWRGKRWCPWTSYVEKVGR